MSGRSARVLVVENEQSIRQLVVLGLRYEAFEVPTAADGTDAHAQFTARTAIDDKLTGLTIGDDYLTKPFSLHEPDASIRVVLRRTRPDPEPARDRLRVADVELDGGTHEVCVRGAGHLPRPPQERP